MEILKFNGVYKDYIWGGEKMREKFNITTDTSPVAESWILSCHKDGMSIISEGEHKGLSLSDYIKNNPESLGNSCPDTELPILIKFIDAANSLSVQVHPDDEQAKMMENQNGKTEMWYIVDAEKDAKITYGVKKDISKEELKNAIENETVEELLDCVPSKKGDVFFVEAGTIHAIGKGNIIAEIQQNSNVTYRLYDYGRRGKDGKPRELHIEKGVLAAKTEKITPKKIPLCSDNTKMIGNCQYFQVREITLNDEEYKLLSCEKSYHALIQTEGESTIVYDGGKEKLRAGECVFIPANSGEYYILGKGITLLCQNPPKYYLEKKDGKMSVVDEYGVVYATDESKEDLIKNAGLSPCDIENFN